MTYIRILEPESNKRGDLFNRLLEDLFVAMGYEGVHFNTAKAGREIDLEARHRIKPERAIAEAKATGRPIGGAEINKFLGILVRERKAYDEVTWGFYISLAGFTSTANAQENESGSPEVICLDSGRVVEELITSNRLISKERAAEMAGRCCAKMDNLVLDSEAEILAHERGWIWALYYLQGRSRTNFALVHSDGTPLAETIANEVIEADRACGGELHKLNCLNPHAIAVRNKDGDLSNALKDYRRYLADECGFIPLDGLPADSDVGSRRLKLENLFVPLNVDLESVDLKSQEDLLRLPFGNVFGKHSRLALLAAPGGGKSTLIKRLAVAYSDPDRHQLIDDNLPTNDWFPIFIRCRELRGLARGSFAELLESICHREPIRQYSDLFQAYIDRMLLKGKILLLVDGLDEISDPGDRAAFACTLRTALQAYPTTAMVVTSREAGFRHVAVHLAPVCKQVIISPFDTDDIRRLCVDWYREVIGDTNIAYIDAENLARTIVENGRIMSIAINPLLLTTLLVVKRWVGSLPTRRAILYGKTIEVLLRTWNTEGHAPIPEDEALPQLCYIAFAMTVAGTQKISRPRLSKLLQEARESLPIELGYVRDTVNQFINRIEDRSSLLVMTGCDVEDGRLVEFFEFRHLTFQEFLTARAVVEGWHPKQRKDATFVTILEQHFESEKWREIIPLAAVLGGKLTEALIKSLIEHILSAKAVKQLKNNIDHMLVTLGYCLADEAPAHPNTIKAAIRQLIQMVKSLETVSFFPSLTNGRYGSLFREEVRKAYLSATSSLDKMAKLLSSIVWLQTPGTKYPYGYKSATVEFTKLLKNAKGVDRCEGALGYGFLCFSILADESHGDSISILSENLRDIVDYLVPVLYSDVLAEQYAACFALEWIGPMHLWCSVGQLDVLGRLFELWQHSQSAFVRDKACLAISHQPIMSRGNENWCALNLRKEAELLFTQRFDDFGRVEKTASLVFAWYLRFPWNDKAIAQRAITLLNESDDFNDELENRIISDLLSSISEKDRQDAVNEIDSVVDSSKVHEEIVSHSPAMKQIRLKVEMVAQTNATVLILGERGTGKTFLAQTVHRLSARAERPLVIVNCASLLPTLIESELFGREKGAYTGALTRMTGRFEAADGATLFLDEIDELPREVQYKLLHVLQEGRFERLGSTSTREVDVRVIAAASQNLAAEVDRGRFRRDLYYRLNVFPIAVPSLRERPEDIPLLVWTFVKQLEKKMGKRIEHIPRKTMEALQHYRWPGNAWELKNVIEQSLIVSSGKILVVEVPKVVPPESAGDPNL